MDDRDRAELEEAMPEQYHHMVTRCGDWHAAFNAVLQDANLDLDIIDRSNSWNAYAR